MKNYRVFDGTTQYIAADDCEVTNRNIVFQAEGKIVRIYEVAKVSRVEELDDSMRTRALLYHTEPSNRKKHKS